MGGGSGDSLSSLSAMASAALHVAGIAPGHRSRRRRSYCSWHRSAAAVLRA